eukprot:CAMPEP_0197438408 /NCGR_PEP_ID=MMETSP1175-20131217/5418_1 /TAXON_ID=1003142 /ORGANISM="Triceratium dubium, Strain CCMP147" /LENGTH=899 /DNA_ID=CAMNT_0042968133 /DNA_START=47 /DNA_END=2743 /DNA_ORIENTATION=-
MESQSLNEAFELLEIATKLEEDGNDNASEPSSSSRQQQRLMEASTKYFEACFLLKRYVNRMPVETSNSKSDSAKTRRLLLEKIRHYERHASNLLQRFGGEDDDGPPGTIGINGSGSGGRSGWTSQRQSSIRNFRDEKVVSGGANAPSITRDESVVMEKAGRANSLLAQALDLDERGKEDEAIDMYMKAAEIYLEDIKMAEDLERKGMVEQTMLDMLKRRLEGALGRIEKLKSGEGGITPQGAQHLAQTRIEPRSSESPGSLSAAEISVLKRSSLIASGLFLPWSDEEARTFNYKTPDGKPWKDPDGLLMLSDKQRARIHKWARPHEILSMRGGSSAVAPVMIKAITPYTIRQKCVTDCSFIASLCICAAFERRFKRRLVTSIIYPQDVNGVPIYNPQGKYMVKFWLNGVARRVIVDDLLPVDQRGYFLCSHTDTKGGLELWVSIIEKAYMKLCGGYDFPGSNSGVDLFSLTGWIPERIFFPEKPDKVRDFETPVERVWERVYSANSYGDCLITMAVSSDITEDKAKQVGLVTGHAYAVLSCIKTSNGTRLLQLKNPWAHQGWKGRYSAKDRTSWKDPRFCAEVGYNPALASEVDDGVFWICWEDVLVYFRNVQLSWNPALFPFRTTVHSFWPKDQGPSDDSFNVGDNPQYILTMSDKALQKKSSIWILLSRHVTKQEQEGMEVQDYLTLHIHRNTREKDRMWYPGGKKCVLRGAYTNNCHVLVRYDVAGPEDKYLSLVLSQYQKSHDLGFTLSCFCTNSFKLGQPMKDQPMSTSISSEWTEPSAGGPIGQEFFRNNPMWSLVVPAEGAFVQTRCSSVKTFAINVLLIEVDSPGKRIHSIDRKPVIDTGDYRHGFVATNAIWVPGGKYTLVASTFHRGQTGRFQIELKSSVKLNPIPIAW